MKYPVDLHTHTIMSGHAYSTIKEMATAAAARNMMYLGISEHAPGMPGSCQELYFLNLKAMPRKICGVNMLYGCEVNIIDYKGKIDLRAGILKRLDYVIASLHIPCIKPGTIEENTMASIGAIENPFVDILGHPDDDRYPIDMERVILALKEHGKIMEVNNSSLRPTASRVGAKENYIRLLELCKQYRVPILIGSDAHYEDYVGEFSEAEELLKNTDFPKELIINSQYDNLAFLESRKKRIAKLTK